MRGARKVANPPATVKDDHGPVAAVAPLAIPGQVTPSPPQSQSPVWTPATGKAAATADAVWSPPSIRDHKNGHAVGADASPDSNPKHVWLGVQGTPAVSVSGSMAGGSVDAEPLDDDVEDGPAPLNEKFSGVVSPPRSPSPSVDSEYLDVMDLAQVSGHLSAGCGPPVWITVLIFGAQEIQQQFELHVPVASDRRTPNMTQVITIQPFDSPQVTSVVEM
jgi:hypothetical protein